VKKALALIVLRAELTSQIIPDQPEMKIPVKRKKETVVTDYAC
jgi:hypothetical protein